MAQKSESRAWRVLVINPGSTSTKVGLFDGEKPVFTANVAHEAVELAKFAGVSDQLPYRLGLIEAALAENGVDLASVDAFVGRGGGLLPLPGGTYEVDDVLLDHSKRGANGVQHPAQLGPQIAHALAARCGRPAFVVNPPDTDELCDEARMTGVRGVYRHVHLHALNLKETAIRHAASMGRAYEDCRFVVCHIGGGISVSAHDHGKMVDGADIVGGEGPMAPTRAGALPVAEVLNYLEAGHGVAETRRLCMKTGGFVDLLGTSDALEVSQRAEAGDEAARRAWDAMVY
ncbi:MAG: butyrate kinase, partial [Coriobacteriaceae bacterium]|nr:butyrate kinase [Coriobacteriaceae bacterium]